jgi:hypothetical protein
MTSKRASLWDRARYLAASKEAAAQVTARRNGEHTVRVLPDIWPTLTSGEKSVMEYLLLVGSPTVVALHNEDVLDGLVLKGLLQRPVGVGTLLMNHYETTYDVPAAVWRALNDGRRRFLPYSGAELERRRRETRERLHGRILVLERAAEPRLAPGSSEGS